MATQLASQSTQLPRCSADVPFERIGYFLEKCAREIKNVKKVETLRLFREKYVPRSSDDLFQIYRLLLPKYDTTRGNYQLKEKKLATALAKACSLNEKSRDYESVVNWRGSAAANAGKYLEVLMDHLFTKYCTYPEKDPRRLKLTCGEVNAKLDELAQTEAQDGKISILRWLVTHTTPTQMKWITAIILKEIKIGKSSETILRDFHPDAEELYNCTHDLERVCRELRDQHYRMPQKDIEVGLAIKPQLAKAIPSVADAVAIMKGQPFVTEIKFDGERMQLHRLGNDVKYFSRRGFEHGDKSDYTVLDAAVRRLLNSSQCILDGEMVVWNKTRKCFEPFGGLKSAVNAAREGFPLSHVVETSSWRQAMAASVPGHENPTVADIEILYIAFDILYKDGRSLIDLPLRERQQHLRATVQACPPEGVPAGQGAIAARILALLPGLPLLPWEERTFSKYGHTQADIQEMFDTAVTAGEEGVIIKALDSLWRVNDRGNSWLKIKPDYMQTPDVDAVIIGGYYGTGRHGRRVAEHLLGIAVQPAIPTEPPRYFQSFCRVGTGMSDEERQTIRDKLADQFIDAHTQPVPHYYRVSGNTKETPDVWVKNPFQSVVLQVHGDMRTIVSEVFAARHSLRFPRVERIRWDKDPADVTTDEQLDQWVRDGKGSLANRAREDVEGELGGYYGRRKKAAKKAAKKPAKEAKLLVPRHLRPVDLSGVEVEMDVLEGRSVCFLGDVIPFKREELQALVKQLGGQLHMNVIRSGERKTDYLLALQQQPALQGYMCDQTYDILRIEWLLDCRSREELLRPAPRHYIQMSAQTRLVSSHHDKHGDPYFDKLDPEGKDLQAILDKHLDQLALAEVKRSAAAAGAALASRRQDPLADDKPDEGVEGPLTLEQMVQEVEKQLRAHNPPLLIPNMSLFRGCNVFILDLGLGPETLSPAAGGAGPPVQVLKGVPEALRTARAWRHKVHQNKLEDLKLQVISHGGSLQGTLAKGVTHIALYTPRDALGRRLPPVSPAQVIQALVHAAHASAEKAAEAAAARRRAAASSGATSAKRKRQATGGSKGMPAANKQASAADAADTAAGDAAAAAAVESAGGKGDVAGFTQLRVSRLLSYVRQRLESEELHLVDWRWIQDSEGTLAKGEQARLRSIQLYPPWVTGMAQCTLTRHVRHHDDAPNLPTLEGSVSLMPSSMCADSMTLAPTTASQCQSAADVDGAQYGSGPGSGSRSGFASQSMTLTQQPSATQKFVAVVEQLQTGGGGYSSWPWEQFGITVGDDAPTTTSAGDTTTASDGGSEGGRGARASQGKGRIGERATGRGRVGHGRGRGGRGAPQEGQETATLEAPAKQPNCRRGAGRLKEAAGKDAGGAEEATNNGHPPVKETKRTASSRSQPAAAADQEQQQPRSSRVCRRKASRDSDGGLGEDGKDEMSMDDAGAEHAADQPASAAAQPLRRHPRRAAHGRRTQVLSDSEDNVDILGDVNEGGHSSRHGQTSEHRQPAAAISSHKEHADVDVLSSALQPAVHEPDDGLAGLAATQPKKRKLLHPLTHAFPHDTASLYQHAVSQQQQQQQQQHGVMLLNQPAAPSNITLGPATVQLSQLLGSAAQQVASTSTLPGCSYAPTAAPAAMPAAAGGAAAGAGAAAAGRPPPHVSNYLLKLMGTDDEDEDGFVLPPQPAATAGPGVDAVATVPTNAATLPAALALVSPHQMPDTVTLPGAFTASQVVKAQNEQQQEKQHHEEHQEQQQQAFTAIQQSAANAPAPQPLTDSSAATSAVSTQVQQQQQQQQQEQQQPQPPAIPKRSLRNRMLQLLGE